jgi:hypothetical protein
VVRVARTSAALGIVLVACSPRVVSVGQLSSGGGGSAGEGIASLGSDTDGSDTDTEPGDATSTSNGGLKLDVSPQFDLGSACGEVPCPGCNAVDILFVIDNSVSMEDYQQALAVAFPGFAATIFDALPPGTSVHVGITSTTMGHSASGATMNCTATGDDMQPVDAFYTTPDVQDTGVGGAQGRLFVVDGRAYFEVSTSDTPEELAGWFGNAALIGENGSQVEMSGAAAGWATDPANDATNDGFIRDEGAVLVLFFIQDEPDQTPPAAAEELVDKIAAAKQACGGFQCVVAGGFVQTSCLPENPLGAILDAVGDPVVEQLPFFSDDTTAELFEQVLRDTLAQVIVQTCEQIPVG